MDRAAAYVRRAGLACVGLFSVSIGVSSIWVVARPDVIGRLPTPTLFGVVGLLILPLAAVGALLLDRRALAARGATRADARPTPTRFLGDPAPAIDERGPASLGRTATTHAAESGRHGARRHRHQRAAMPAPE